MSGRRRLPFLKAVIVIDKVYLLLREKQTLRPLNKALWQLPQIVEVFAQGSPKLPLTKSYLQACPFGSAAHWANEIMICFWEWAEADQWPSLAIV